MRQYTQWELSIKLCNDSCNSCVNCKFFSVTLFISTLFTFSNCKLLGEKILFEIDVFILLLLLLLLLINVIESSELFIFDKLFFGLLYDIELFKICCFWFSVNLISRFWDFNGIVLKLFPLFDKGKFNFFFLFIFSDELFKFLFWIFFLYELLFDILLLLSFDEYLFFSDINFLLNPLKGVKKCSFFLIYFFLYKFQ